MIRSTVSLYACGGRRSDHDAERSQDSGDSLQLPHSGERTQSLGAVGAVVVAGAFFLRFATVEWPEAEQFLEEIGPGARRELLRVLRSPAEVRADVIRQFFHRRGGGEMAELLILLEEREWARQAIVETLLRLEDPG